jgi:hypothetical protein
MWHFTHKQILSSQQYVTMCMRRNQIIIVFYGRGTFQISKYISGMELHLTLGFLNTNKNQLTLYTYYYTTSDFSLTRYCHILTQKWVFPRFCQ